MPTDKPLKIDLVERFFSIQGEGAHTGIPMYFLRTKGCDVGCAWCDTKYSWDEGPPTPQNIERGGGTFTPAEIVALIRKEAPSTQWVCLTGGEPLMHGAAVGELLSELGTADYMVHIETSGVYKVPTNAGLAHVYICCSPKHTISPTFKKLHPSVVEFADEFKLVYPAFGTYEQIVQFIGRCATKRSDSRFSVCIQPEFYADKERNGAVTRDCIELVKRLAGVDVVVENGIEVRLSVQQHKPLGVR